MTEYFRFKCWCCGDYFISDLTDEEAIANYEERFHKPLNKTIAQPVCADCYDLLEEELDHDSDTGKLS